MGKEIGKRGPVSSHALFPLTFRETGFRFKGFFGFYLRLLSLSGSSYINCAAFR